jgi:Methyltransferase domain
MMTADLFNKLCKNAYTDLDISNYQVDLQGWMDNGFASTFSEYLLQHDLQNPMTIIEVGSWKGLSTSTMAQLCKAHNIKANIYAIDTWLGAQEFWTWGYDDPTRGLSLKLVNGYPSVFYTFTKNMKSLGHHDTIAPLPLPSSVALDVLKHHNILADVIYIDAAHDYESVKQDILAYKSLVRPGGMIFGDDYTHHWNGVMKAVDETLPQRAINGVVWSAKPL